MKVYSLDTFRYFNNTGADKKETIKGSEIKCQADLDRHFENINYTKALEQVRQGIQKAFVDEHGGNKFSDEKNK